MTEAFDLAVVGAGICGLAHALAAAGRGKRVVVIDRDARANGASVRNFGSVTVTGRQEGACWRRALRSRDVSAEVAPAAGMEIVQRGLLTMGRRPEARAVLEEFCQTEMGGTAACWSLPRWRPATTACELARWPALSIPRTRSRSSRATPSRLAAYLADRRSMTFVRDAAGGDEPWRHVRAAIFDWAGTVVDHGSLAPMGPSSRPSPSPAWTSASTSRAGPWAWPSAPTSRRS